MRTFTPLIPALLTCIALWIFCLIGLHNLSVNTHRTPPIADRWNKLAYSLDKTLYNIPADISTPIDNGDVK